MANKPLVGISDTDVTADVETLVRSYADKMKTVDAALREARIAAEEEAAESFGKAMENVHAEIARLQSEGAFKNEYERAQYAKKLATDLQKQRLEDELEALQIISKKAEKEREKEKQVLEHKKKVLAAQVKYEEAKKNGTKEEQKAAKKELKKAKVEQSGSTKDGISEGLAESFKELNRQLEEGTAVQETAAKNTQTALKSVGKAITEGLNAINNAITAYAKHQTAVNARLNGVSSYSKIATSLSLIAYSPLLKAEDLYANVADLAGQGIATNIEQRALLMTVKDGIATTFDATNESLKRIIRVQQNDSTAARMGLEAYLTKFLNVYVENTEYLQSTFDNVASSLLEASAMLKYNTSDVGASLEFEYQVQKWLGTLTGLGLSDQAAQSIATAIGQLGSGDVEGLTGNDINNLLLMGASKSGKVSYSDMLSQGMTADDVNNLMQGVLAYMQDIANFDNNIVKNQLAKTFGLSVSDVLSSKNISDHVLAEVVGDSLSYEGMYTALADGFDALPARLGISNILDNLMSNLTYQTGANIAANPALFALWKITDLIKVATNGQDIAVPFISAMGNGFDLNTGVANLMQMAIAGGGLLAGIPGIIAGLASAVNGSSLMTLTGMNAKSAVIQEVEGGLSKRKDGKRESGDSTSGGQTIVNNDADTYSDSALNEANDDAQKKVDAAKEKEEDPTVKYLKEEVFFTQTLFAILASTLNLSNTGTIVSNNVRAFMDLYRDISIAQATGIDITSAITASLAKSAEAGMYSSEIDLGEISELPISLEMNTSMVSFEQLSELLSPETFFASILTRLDTGLFYSKLIAQGMLGVDASTLSTAFTSFESTLAASASESDGYVSPAAEAAKTAASSANLSDALTSTLASQQLAAEPEGDRSILSDSYSSSTAATYGDTNDTQILTNYDLFINSNEFMEGFKLIVQNVVKMGGQDTTSKSWNEPLGGGSTNSMNQNISYNSGDQSKDIAGLTQTGTPKFSLTNY
mgnify:CR=1 FL=1